MKDELVSELFNSYYKELCFFADNLLGSVISHEGHDVVVNVFVKISRFERDEIKNYKSFLVDLVKKECLNVLKSEKRRNIRERLSFNLSNTNDSDLFADAKLVKSEVVSRLGNLYQNMPSERRKVFDLLYFEGKSVIEVSQILKIKVDTVRVQKHRIGRDFEFFGQECYTNVSVRKDGSFKIKSRLRFNK